MLSQTLSTAFISVAIAFFFYFVERLLAARRSVWSLQKAGLPMPEFNSLTGHLLTIKEASETFPPNTVMHNVFWHISKQFPIGLFYIDLWPFARTTLVVTTPSAAIQVEGFDLGVPDDIVPPIETITGGPSLLTMPIGPEWKHRRRTLSPGFNASSMMALAPAVADQVTIFRDLLMDGCASGTSEPFQLEDLTLKLTFDVIGVVTLGTKMHYQTRDSKLASAMRTQIEWTTFTAMNPIQRYLSIRPLIHWFYGRRMNHLIAEEIDKRVDEKMESRASGKKKPETPSMVSLLLDEILRDQKGDDDAEEVKETMKTTMTAQLRAFLFGGHDTTSSTLLYCYYLIETHPQVLNKIMAEHDQVFGQQDPSTAHEQICQDPLLLNKLPYTLAVIKEVLRIFPPAASMRIGRDGADIVDEDGQIYPTKNCNVWTLTLAIHHNPKYWVEPEAFNPERWLVGPDDPLYPVKGAWRPFQHGPKNCLGQPLALLELKICLVMTIREFCFTPAYDKWDSKNPRKSIKTVNGVRAYQAEKGGGGAHPADGFPVTVKMRQRKSQGDSV